MAEWLDGIYIIHGHKVALTIMMKDDAGIKFFIKRKYKFN